MTEIYVDGDACPVREEVYRVATRLGLDVFVVSNGSRPLRPPGTPNVRMIFVGDAAMSLYEIVMPGGSVEHMNPEAGETWMARVTRTYPACVWLNPVPENQWDMTYSVRMIRQLFGNRMYPLTLDGLDRAMRELVR